MSYNTPMHQKILYGAIAIVTTLTVTICLIDTALSRIKPEFIKINGKVDKNLQFNYTIALSCILLFFIIFLCYAIFA